MFDVLNLETILVLLTLGAFAGVMAGLLGVGGGLIIVPALIFVFEAWQFPDVILTQMAVATSLCTIVFTSLSSIYAHHRNGLVDWRLVSGITVGLVLGAVAGAMFATAMAGNLLRLLFGIFAIGVALQMFLGLAPQTQKGLPGIPGQVASGVVVASVSALFGIGGGSLSVPLLHYFGLQMKNAVAVSAACGFPIAVFSSITYGVSGSAINELPQGSIGYIYVPAVLLISITSVSCAPLGANLANRLPARKLKQTFAFFLSLVGVRLIVSSF